MNSCPGLLTDCCVELERAMPTRTPMKKAAKPITASDFKIKKLKPLPMRRRKVKAEPVPEEINFVVLEGKFVAVKKSELEEMLRSNQRLQFLVSEKKKNVSKTKK